MSNTADGVLAWDTTAAPHARTECVLRNERYKWHKLTDLDARRLPIRSGKAVIRLSVNGRPCDRRDFIEEYGTWTGHYRHGFESSSFAICGDSARKSIWVEFTTGAWEALPTGRADRGSLLLRVRGRLVGPWAYGHLNAAEYQLTVDSVLFARPQAEGAADCMAVVP